MLLSDRSELVGLRTSLADKPTDPHLAAMVASRYLQIGKQDGDPRFYGYARSALAPWWDHPAPPAEILQLRAKLKERDHQFDAAVHDLRQLLRTKPRDVQAWLELTNLLRVQGRYDQAREAVAMLDEFAPVVPRVLASAPIQAACGDAADAYRALGQALPIAEQNLPDTVVWIVTTQAEIARALGRNEQAARHFQQGLTREPHNDYLLRAYADFLIDNGRAEQALELLRERLADTGVLLRAAISARRSGDLPQAQQWQRQLETRFEEIRLRGSLPHGRFEARCALELQDDPQRAVEIAAANWDRQKEYRDTRILLEAALAANDRGPAREALKFLRTNGAEDVVLLGLVAKLETLE